MAGGACGGLEGTHAPPLDSINQTTLEEDVLFWLSDLSAGDAELLSDLDGTVELDVESTWKAWLPGALKVDLWEPLHPWAPGAATAYHTSPNAH